MYLFNVMSWNIMTLFTVLLICILHSMKFYILSATFPFPDFWHCQPRNHNALTKIFQGRDCSKTTTLLIQLQPPYYIYYVKYRNYNMKYIKSTYKCYCTECSTPPWPHCGSDDSQRFHCSMGLEFYTFFYNVHSCHMKGTQTFRTQLLSYL